jgi:YebC/PmpR family DNA-binding regulatory protein
MSGHSKWAKIKRKKASTDAKRGNIFTKLIKEITIAAKHGGGDPDANPRLRSAIDSAKSLNMPNENINRAIKRGTGELEGQILMEIAYEVYGPSGVAILIEVVTDNRNRITSEIRHVLSRYNGSMGGQGSVAWQFQIQGIITIDQSKYDEDTIIAYALEGGATDVKTEDNAYQIITAPDNFSKVKNILQKNNVETMSSEITKIPQSTVALSDKEAEKALKLYEALDDLEDVQHVYTNFEISDALMEKISAQG